MTSNNKLFPIIIDDNKLVDKLLTDDIGSYSITRPKEANIISKLIQSKFGTNNIVITDATAGVGGNVLSFSHYFNYVHAIEIDQLRVNYLINNLSIYKRSNVCVYNNDMLKIIFTLKQDVIFIDPPWGGKDYKMKTNIRLQISNIDIEQICNMIMDNKCTKLIVIKLPLNYDMEYLKNMINSEIEIYNIKNKMNIIFIAQKNEFLIV